MDALQLTESAHSRHVNEYTPQGLLYASCTFLIFASGSEWVTMKLRGTHVARRMFWRLLHSCKYTIIWIGSHTHPWFYIWLFGPFASVYVQQGLCFRDVAGLLKLAPQEQRCVHYALSCHFPTEDKNKGWLLSLAWTLVGPHTKQRKQVPIQAGKEPSQWRSNGAKSNKVAFLLCPQRAFQRSGRVNTDLEDFIKDLQWGFWRVVRITIGALLSEWKSKPFCVG